jgi:hypothetical protein
MFDIVFFSFLAKGLIHNMILNISYRFWKMIAGQNRMEAITSGKYSNSLKAKYLGTILLSDFCLEYRNIRYKRDSNGKQERMHDIL